MLEFGSLDGLSSDGPERLHIDEVKDPYRRSNKVDPEEQMLMCRGRMHQCSALIRMIEGRGECSLSALARAAREKKAMQKGRKVRKVRSSHHQLIEDAWRAGKIKVPPVILGSLRRYYLDNLS
jgi:hypothetical protein